MSRKTTTMLLRAGYALPLRWFSNKPLTPAQFRAAHKAIFWAHVYKETA